MYDSSQFKIITDTSCDIPDGLIRRHNIGMIPYYVSFEPGKYYKERFELSIKDFYARLATEKSFPRTSLPPVQDYIDAFSTYLNEGRDVLCFCLTSKFSGSYQSANTAKNILAEKHFDNKVTVIDSYSATVGQGLIVMEAVKMRDAGYSMDKCTQVIERLKPTATIILTAGSLEYLRRGGRLGRASALAGSLLNIKPIIRLDDGELLPHSKVRGYNKMLKELVRILMESLEGGYDNYEIVAAHAGCEEYGQRLVRLLKDNYGVKTRPIWEVGITIGCHIGPMAMGVAAVRKYDKL